MPVKVKLEATTEKEVRHWVEKIEKGIWIKLIADGRKGIPDNLLLLPPVIIDRYEYPLHLIVELKRTHGGIVSPHQEEWLFNLSSLAQPVHVCYTLDHVKDVVEFERQSIRRKVLGCRADLS
jgi:hypothetical protein